MPTNERIITADALGARWSRYAAMMRDCGHNGPSVGDGILRLDELQWYMDGLVAERNEALRLRESTQIVDMRLRESIEMLDDMKRAGVDGLFYLPPQFDDMALAPHLRQRVTEILMRDDEDKIGRVTQHVLDRARGRYYNLPPVSSHTLFVRERALAEIDEIARKLGLI